MVLSCHWLLFHSHVNKWTVHMDQWMQAYKTQKTNTNKPKDNFFQYLINYNSSSLTKTLLWLLEHAYKISICTKVGYAVLFMQVLMLVLPTALTALRTTMVKCAAVKQCCHKLQDPENKQPREFDRRDQLNPLIRPHLPLDLGVRVEMGQLLGYTFQWGRGPSISKYLFLHWAQNSDTDNKQ